MMQVVVCFFISLFYMGAALILILLSRVNAALVDSAKPFAVGCFALPVLLLTVCVYSLVYDSIRIVLCKPAAAGLGLTAVLTILLLVPSVLLEWALPGQGWLLSILSVGVVWSVVVMGLGVIVEQYNGRKR